MHIKGRVIIHIDRKGEGVSPLQGYSTHLKCEEKRIII
jgi:hypothetical protein